MPTLNLVIIIGLFAIVTLLILLFVFSDSSTTVKRRREKPQTSDGKNFEEVTAKLEKYIYSLRGELEKLRNEQKKNLKDLAVEKLRNEKLHEKIRQENEWLEKEKISLEKKDDEIRELKERVVKLEQEREQEYAAKLQFERQGKEVKADCEALIKEKRELSLKVMTLESELESHKKELAKQRKINQELTKKNDEVNWVSRAEYARLEKLLQEKEKELEKLR